MQLGPFFSICVAISSMANHPLRLRTTETVLPTRFREAVSGRGSHFQAV